MISGHPDALKEWKRTVKSVQKWMQSQGHQGNLEELAKQRVKYTLPGPMTILDCIVDQFYGPDKKREMIEDLICIINKVI